MMIGMSPGSVVTHFEKFISVAYDRLVPVLIKWPSADERALPMADLFARNEHNNGLIPGVFGVIRGSHIRLDPH